MNDPIPAQVKWCGQWYELGKALKGPFVEVLNHDLKTWFRVRKGDCEAATFLDLESYTYRTVSGPFANNQLV
ncbi:hypothetical protein C8D87_104184 [Lentzea atacamensis]|uniref:Uncharacterized protein n=1 Tax=Lentzea atacamensis TaxID=531938 RepID=A0ABX9EAH8_9PSEU|nr:hypothetical protein C8D87_104184 [Lentzea atacamensis]